MARNTTEGFDNDSISRDNTEFALDNSGAENMLGISMEQESKTIGTESQDSHDKKKGGWPKGKKRKKTDRDVNAPRQPLTGYLHFLNDRRGKLRSENQSLSFAEISKILGAEWNNLPMQEKQRYLDEAEHDKERYTQELQAYHKTDTYRLFARKQQDKKKKKGFNGHTAQAPAVSASNGVAKVEPPSNATNVSSRKDDEVTSFDIPIFTEEFLDQNKVRETELRQLRKQNTEFEEQNAILSKHIDNMKSAIEKLDVESVQLRSNNQALDQHLAALRHTLATSFACLPMPGSNEVPTADSIDVYMAKLHSLMVEMPHENERYLASAREIIKRLNFFGL